jgi:putative ABC transport system ATP-binding protein
MMAAGSMAESSRLVETSDLTKRYVMGEKGQIVINALEGITLGVEKGEFTSVMGPSGSGKTTLLNILSGLDRPSEGRVWLVGTETTDLTQAEKSKIRQKYCGFIFQVYNLIPVMSAIENVELPLVFQRMPEEDRKERAQEVLKRVGLEKRMYHRPTELSGGEQQRVAIARALVVSPQIIFADEVTGNLDTKTGLEIIDLLYSLNNEQNVTVIFATHDPKVQDKSARTVYLRDGKVVADEARK